MVRAAGTRGIPLSPGPDAKNSATPEEMTALVKGIRDAEKALYCKIDKDEKANSLQEMKITFEKSIVASCDISKGTVINEKHLAYKKPGVGLPAKDF